MTQQISENDTSQISRRDFIKTTVVVGSSLALLSQIPHGETILKAISPAEAQSKLQSSDQVTTVVRVFGFSGGGMGSPAVCVDVKNGRILRVRPLHFDWLYSPSDYNYDNWKLTASNGKVFSCPTKTLPPPFTVAYKKRAYSPNRTMYPLKRVDFDPTAAPTNRNTANRGKSKFVRISWDDAINMLYNEIVRVKDTYGSLAVYGHSHPFHGEDKAVHPPGGVTTLLNEMIGNITTEARDPDSWEGWYWGAKHMWGNTGGQGTMYTQDNVFIDLFQNSELVLCSGDPETTPWGWDGQISGTICYWLKQAGKHVIYITPTVNYAAAIHADKWIPIIPNTDIAMDLAIAYTWITEGTYDKNYVATHTLGFDDSTLPAGAPPNGSYKSYVMGIVDGVPKTPKWAEGICGVPSRTIKALAREWGSKLTATIHGNGGGMIRGPYSTEPARARIALFAMQGIGKPGVEQVKMIEFGMMEGFPLPRGLVAPSTGAAGVYSFFKTVPGITNNIIQKNYLQQGILNPPAKWYGTSGIPAPASDQFVYYQYPEPGAPEIHMMYHDGANQITSWTGGFKLVEAFRSPKIEFNCFQGPWFEDDMLYGDLILPVTTNFENDVDMNIDVGGGTIWTLNYQAQAIDPLGESKSDLEIYEALATKFGMLDTFNLGESHMDMAKMGFNLSGVANMISWDDWVAKQYFPVPVDPNWASYARGFSWFYNLPVGSGLETPSGKIEFFCTDIFQNMPNDTERPPLLHYITQGPYHDESLFGTRAKTYPLLCIAAHPHWRVHSQHDDISWLREIKTCKVRGPDGYQYEPIWLNPVDAAKRGINSGDILQLYNERGAVLGGAYVTERQMAGSVWMDHGARLDFLNDDSAETGIDRGGSSNVPAPWNPCSTNVAGLCATGFLVEVKKADMADLMAKYPDAFARPWDPATGPSPATARVTTGSD